MRCIQCDIHKTKNPPGELTNQERLDTIEQIADWNRDINIVLTGGEPFMRKPELYSIAQTAKAQRVYLTVSTNGTLVTRRDIERIPRSGINDIVISIDSHRPEVHDKIRGQKGTFERASRTIRHLVSQVRNSEENVHVLTSTIIGGHNINEMEEMVAFLDGLGADAYLFQPIQPTFMGEFSSEWWKDNPLFPREARNVDSAIDAILRAKREGNGVYQKEYQLEVIRRYLKREPLLPGQCNSMDRNMMIDIIGNVRLCFNMERIGMEPISNIRSESLMTIWNRSEGVRAKMRGCTECCGVMICHAR
ncbi:MAG: radical SAM protein [Thermoplasmata archaeon]|nr:radical SAM protein [Thermoplasmata archaeon]